MSVVLTCFTNLDSLFDPRRGIITKVALENGNTKFDWDKNFAEIYARRRYDHFNQPELKITPEKYAERYDKRSIDDFADDTQSYIRPSWLIRRMFALVREQEFGVGQMISAGGFAVTVNLYPYKLSDTLIDELSNVIKGAVPFNFSLYFVEKPFDEITPNFLNAYQNVFIYDLLLSKDYKVFWEEYGRLVKSSTRYFVPGVLVYGKDLPEEMRREEPIDLLGKINVAQGGKITLVPVPKTIFDYRQ